eukprot:c14403_g2_i1 orf=320-3346(+)
MQGGMFRGGVGNVLLAPISEVLSRLLVELFTTAMAAKDVLIEQSNFNELSSYLERIAPVLRELQDKNVRDKPPMRSALDSLEHVLKSARSLINECTTKSRINLLYNCRDIVKRLQDVTQEIGRCLSLIPMATLDISIDTRDKTVELFKLMQAVEFKAAVAEEEIIQKLDMGLRERQADSDHAKELLLQIAQVVGVSNNPASLRKELEQLKEEKEEALLRKSQAEAIQLEQILAFLSQADTLRSASERKRPSIGAHPLPPWQPFYCPITNEVMEDPVEIASGLTFEHKAIDAWFSAGNKTCPITKIELDSLDVQPNVSLRNSIKEWRERNTVICITAANTKLQSDLEEDKLSALKELHRLSEERPIHRQWIQEEGLIPVISSLLSNNNKNHIRRTALATLCSLAVDFPVVKEEIADSGAIQHAVRSLARDVKEGRQAVALLLELSGEPSVCEKIGKVQGCILLLVTMSNSANQEAAEDAKQLLRNLSSNIQNVVQMAEANYFKPLVQRLLEGPEMTKTLMASALARMGLTDQSKATIATEGALSPLVKMISSTKLEAKTAALGALQNLSTHPGNRDLMINAGVIPPLLQLLFSVTSVFMNLKEQAAATLANLATASPMETGTDACSTILDSDDTICQLLSLLNLVGPVNQGHLLRALHGMASPATASSVRAKMRGGSAVQLLLPFCELNDAEVRVNAVKLLYSLSQDWANEEIPEHFGPTYIQALVKLLESSREDEKVAAAGIISNLPENDSRLTEMLRVAEALPALIELLRIGGSKTSSRMSRDQLLKTASRALIRFTLPSDTRLQRLTAEHNAIPLLVQVLAVGSQLAKKEAATVLGQLSENSIKLCSPILPSRGFWCFSTTAEEGCKVHIGHCSVKSSFCLIEADAVAPLVQMLEERESEAHEAALTALQTLMKDETWERGAQVIAEAQGLQSLVRLLSVGTAGAKERAAWMLERFFRAEKYRSEFGVQAQMPLIDLAQRGTLTTRSLAAKGLAHLKILHNQSTYF